MYVALDSFASSANHYSGGFVECNPGGGVESSRGEKATAMSITCSHFDCPAEHLDKGWQETIRSLRALICELLSRSQSYDDGLTPVKVKRKRGRPKGSKSAAKAVAKAPAKKTRKPLSAEARKRIADAQRARWAKEKEAA
jgi:hypothetical protein